MSNTSSTLQCAVALQFGKKDSHVQNRAVVLASFSILLVSVSPSAKRQWLKTSAISGKGGGAFPRVCVSPHTSLMHNTAGTDANSRNVQKELDFWAEPLHTHSQ